jgi:DNA-binding GntR family transcriptional regulator
MFETYALRHGSLTSETVVPLRQAVTEARSALEAENFEQWHQAGVRFHDGLVGLALNAHLKRLYDELKISLRRYQISLIGIPDQPKRSQLAHETILDALEHGGLERGVDLVTEHITSLKEALLKAITREMAG